MMKCKAGLGVLLLASSLATCGFAYGDEPRSGYQEEAYAGEPEPMNAVSDEGRPPAGGYVHIQLFPLSVSAGVPGFWRVKTYPGFSWVEGYWKDERYFPGYWRPLRTRGTNLAWVPGHWNGRAWIPGFWRPSQRAGYVWVDGYWDRSGVWSEGYWQPTRVPRGMVWEPGYWNSRGWVEGFWRPEVKVGFVWINGERNANNAWVAGHWQSARHDETWQRAYWDQRGRLVTGRVIKMHDHRGYNEQHYERPEADQHIGNMRMQREENRQLDQYRQNRESSDSEQRQLGNSQKEREIRGGQVEKIGGYPQNQDQNSRTDRNSGWKQPNRSMSQPEPARLRPQKGEATADSDNGQDQQRENRYQQMQSQR